MYIFFTFIISMIVCAKSEYFSSIAALQSLLETEETMIKTIEDFIIYQENRLDFLRAKINQFRHRHRLAKEDAVNNLSSPLHSYLFFKRLLVEWDTVVNEIHNPYVEEVVNYFTSLKVSPYYPTMEDLQGTANAVVAVQNTYEMDIENIIDSNMITLLDASDCYQFGRLAYGHGYYRFAEQWLKETLKRFEASSHQDLPRSELFAGLVHSLYMQGKASEALTVMGNAINGNGSSPALLFAQKLYSDVVLNRRDLKEIQKVELPIDEKFYFDMHKWACQGKSKRTLRELSKLKCRYKKDNPFLMLAPMKLEEVSGQPKIFIIKDALNDSEIRVLKELSSRKLQRAKVYSETGEGVSDETRVTQQARLYDSEHSVVERITQRVEDLTGLHVKGMASEAIQVVNYGIGGEYLFHHDYIPRVKFSNNDNRIATVIFFMSDVALGGATTFPLKNLTIQPEKGSALFWENLFPDGNGNKFTLHAGCPVAKGSKWLAIKWIHYTHQMFNRPCNLKSNDGPLSDEIDWTLSEKEEGLNPILKEKPRENI